MPNEFKITKTLADQNLAFGWATIAQTNTGVVIKDFEDDVVDMESLEPAIYDFVLKYRAANEVHVGPTIGNLVECVVFTKEKMKAMGIPEGVVPEGVWLGFKVNDETFAKVKSGDYEMFSIEGTGRRVPMEV